MSSLYSTLLKRSISDPMTRKTYAKLDACKLIDVFNQSSDFSALATTQLETIHPVKTKELVQDLSYLPIESFKLKPELCFGQEAACKTFLSSGTTTASRSKSQFSEFGLSLYKFQSLLGFYGMLAHFFERPEAVTGISLIPTKQTWPDSSLAQMVDWLAEISNVHFLTPAKENLDSSPVWIFGTAFHFVNLFDQGFKCPLPKGSIIIETGGTKGQSRSVDKDELNDMIGRMFEVNAAAIVSEYGMSELACQAYDFYTPESPRCYKFPAWVKVSVEKTKTIAPSGKGCLIIDDPLRVDVPYPIRTQDVVELRNDRTFTLLGRLKASPLKGCSMLAEPLLVNSKMMSRTAASAVKSPDQKLVPEDVKKRAKQLANEIRKNFFSDTLKTLLFRVVQSEHLTNKLINDLQQSWKSDASFFIDAVSDLNKKGIDNTKSYLLIGPSTHPIAIIHPIIYAYILGKKISLRHTKSFEAFETWLVQIFKNAGMKICTLPSNYYIDGDQRIDADKLIMFGEDKTIQDIKSKTTIPIQGFGSHIAASILFDKEIMQHSQALAYDTLAIRGLGCMRSRVLYVIESTDTTENFSHAITPLLEEITSVLESIEATQDLLAYKHDFIEHQILEHPYITLTLNAQTVFAPVKDFRGQSLSEMISEKPLVLPIIKIKACDLPIFSEWLQKQGSLGHLSASEAASRIIKKAPHQDFTPIGQLNQVSFNGTHHKQSFYTHDTCSR